MKLIRFERPCNGEWPIEDLPKGWVYHNEIPNLKLVEDGLESFKKDIGDYDGMWTIEDYKWRIQNGRKFYYITENDKIIGFVWHSPSGKVLKTWDENNSPVYDTPSFDTKTEVITMDVGDNSSYSYNTWITKKYRGFGRHINLRSFREMEYLGKDSIINDVEIWNKGTVVHCIKHLQENIIDLLDR